MKIGIIGGKGRMGSWFTKFFEKQGLKVLIGDKEGPPAEELAQKVDVLILSVPISELEGLTKRVGPFLKKENLLMDFASIKSLPLKWMLDSTEAEVIGAHPLFGPKAELYEKLSICLCLGRARKWLSPIKEIFERGGLKVIITSPDEHDRNMALIQALHHLSNLTLALLLKKWEASQELLTPGFKKRLSTLLPILEEDPDLYWSMMNKNPFFEEAKRAFLLQFKNLLEEKAFKEGFLSLSREFLSFGGRKKIAYLGPEGTFSHLAASKISGMEFDLQGFSSIEEVFRATEKGETDYALVPVENPIEGMINETHDLLLETPLRIQGEFELEVSYVVASLTDSLSEIKKVFSHPQALGQCRKWLKEHLPWAELIYCSSTAQAALMALKDPHACALVARETAELYNLKVLKEKVEDTALNNTRFFILGKEPFLPSLQPKKATISFLLPHVPGALHRALSPFAERGLNLCRIVSRPLKGSSWEYSFFTDVELGSGFEEALEELKEKAVLVKLLGKYPLLR